MRRGLHIAVTLGLAAATAGGARLALPWHDSLATLVPARPLGGVVVQTDDLAAGRVAALAAGAASVSVALPPGDPRLAGMAPDPGTLAAGPDGRIRLDGDRPLLLPEGLRGITHLDARDLGPGTPPALLSGRDVVLVWTDPTVGRREAAPGRVAPVDRGELLALQLSSEREGAWLRVLPLPLAAAAVMLCGLVASRIHARAEPRVAVARGVAMLVVTWVATLALRYARIDVPWIGVALALTAPLALRVGSLFEEALATLDRVVMRLGVPAPDVRTTSGARAIAQMARVHLPDFGVVSWRGAAGEAASELCRLGPAEQVPALARIPDAPMDGPGWHVVPLREDGAIVGALGIGAPGGVPDDVKGLARKLARVPAAAAAPSPERDPRLQEADRAVGRALVRIEGWERALGDGPLAIGLFDLGGSLMLGSGPMSRLATGEPALLVALEGVTGIVGEALGARIREALAGEGPVRIPGTSGRDAILWALGPVEDRSALLVEVQEAVRADEREPSPLRELGAVLGEVEALAGGIALERDVAARARLLVELGAIVASARRMLGEGPLADGASETVGAVDTLEAVPPVEDASRRAARVPFH